MSDTANIVAYMAPSETGKAIGSTRRDSAQSSETSRSFGSYMAAQNSADASNIESLQTQLTMQPMALYFNPAVSLAQNPADQFTLEDLTANLEGILSEFTLEKGIAPIEITEAGFADGDLQTQVLTILTDLKDALSDGGQAVLNMLTQQKEQPTQAFPALSLIASTPQDITQALEGGTPEDVEALLMQISQLTGQTVQLNEAQANALMNENAQIQLQNQLNANSSPEEIREAIAGITGQGQVSETDMAKIAAMLNDVAPEGDLASGRNAWLNKAINQAMFNGSVDQTNGPAAPANFAEALKAQAQTQNVNNGSPMNSASAAALNSDGAFDISQLDGSWLIDNETLDPAVLEQMGHRGMINPQVTGLGNQTQLSLNAPTAGASHPTTETVAMMIKEKASSGDTSELELQLDPPELGKLKVRLEFGADQQIKAHLTIDKPETYMMLQRDAHTLEKVLQDAGFDTSSDSLSFEMAEQGTDDNGHHKGGSHSHSGGGQDGTDGEIEIIESQMNWYFDPETGAQRYNILA